MSLILYRLKLPSFIRRLHSVLNVVKLTTTPKDFISDQYALSLLDFIIINREKKIESRANLK